MGTQNNLGFSTQGGEIGFSVKLENGQVLTEDKYCWDDIPTNIKIQEFKIVHLKTGHSLISLVNYNWYFFENEATNTVGSGILRHTAKIFGGANPTNGAVEVRLEFSSKSVVPTYSKKEYSWEEWNRLKRRDSGMRQGLAGIII